MAYMQLIIHDNNSLVLNNGYCYKKKPHINIMHIRVVYINTCNSFFFFFFASMLQSVLRYYSRHLLVSLSKHQLPVCDTVQNETWMAINNYIPTLLVLNYT